MKKIFCLLMVMIMAFSMVACAGNSSSGNTDGKDSVQSSINKPDINDKGNISDSKDNDDANSENVGNAEDENAVDPGVEITGSIAQLIVNKIAETNPDTFAANMPMDDEMFGVYYAGLNDLELVDVVAFMPMMSAVVCEIAIVEVANAEDVDVVKAIFQNRIAYQVGDENNPGGAWYPESIEGWKNHSEIVVEGNYVMLIAWSEKDSAIEIFREFVGA